MFRGNYTFAVSCDDNCEVWLSNTSDPLYISKIAFVGTMIRPANTKVADFKQYKSQISKLIFLEEGKKYYVEGLHKQAAYKDHMLLTWLAPSWPRIRSITMNYISSYILDSKNISDVNTYMEYIPETKASNVNYNQEKSSNDNTDETIYKFNHTRYKFGSTDMRDHFHNISLVDSVDFEDLLPPIKYKPSYKVNFTPKRYEGVKLIHESAVYPDDNTELTHMLRYEDCIVHRQLDSHLKQLYTSETPLILGPNAGSWLEQPDFRDKYRYLHSIYKKGKEGYLSESNNQGVMPTQTEDYLLKNIKKPKQKFIDELADTNEPVHRQRKLLNMNNVYNQVPPLSTGGSKSGLLDKESGKTKNIVKDNIRQTKNNIKDYKPNVSARNVRFVKKAPPLIGKFGNTGYAHIVRNTASSGIFTGYNTGHRRYAKRKRMYYEGKVSSKIGKKIYFRGGASPNITITDNRMMIRLYEIFGPAIHYLSQSDDRGLLWMYNSVLSTCRSDGNLLLSKEVRYYFF